jgi:hypothetical protein
MPIAARATQISMERSIWPRGYGTTRLMTALSGCSEKIEQFFWQFDTWFAAQAAE